MTSQIKEKLAQFARYTVLYYTPEHGRSRYTVRCECGKETEVYCWAGCKKCPNCGKMLTTLRQFQDED